MEIKIASLGKLKKWLAVWLVFCICATIFPSSQIMAVESNEEEAVVYDEDWDGDEDDWDEDDDEDDWDCTVRFVYPRDFEDYLSEKGYSTQGGVIKDEYGENGVRQISGIGIDVRVKRGEKLSESEWLADNGKREIIGWTETLWGTEPYNFSLPVKSEKYLYPIVDKNRITFSDWRNEDFSLEDIYVKKGEKITQPDYDPPENYESVFNGWRKWWSYYGEGDIFDFDKVSVDQDYTLEADYRPNYSCYVKIYGDDVSRLYGINYKIKNGTDRNDAVIDRYGTVREGYVYTGLYYDMECTKEYKFGTKFNPFYFTNDTDDRGVSCAAKLYVGWKKKESDTKNIGYCQVRKLERKNGSEAWKEKETYLIESGTVLSDKLFPESSYIKRYKYKFIEYYTDESLQTIFDKTKAIIENVNIYEKSGDSYILCTINDGSSIKSEKIFDITKYPEPNQREGYTFTGWYYDKECTFKWEQGVDMTENPLFRGNLYAGWQKGGNGVIDYTKPNLGYYTVKFDLNYKGNTTVRSVLVGKELAPNGYKNILSDVIAMNQGFLGWFLDEKGTVPFSFDSPVNSDITVYAKWDLDLAGEIITRQNGTEVKPDKEHMLAKIPAKSATCAMGGNIEYYSCSRCGKVFKDSKGLEELKANEWILPKKTHSYTVIIEKATAAKNGKIEKRCSVCRQIAETSIIYCPKEIILSELSYVYSGKGMKPSVIVKDSKGKVIPSSNYTVRYSNNIKVGTAKAEVVFREKYSGSLTADFSICPKGTSVTKLTPKKKAFVVKWKKQDSEMDGYEILYSTDKKFAKKKTFIKTVKKKSKNTLKIKKLKANKRYFVKIRIYKTVNGNKFYSGWSKIQKVKTKK